MMRCVEIEHLVGYWRNDQHPELPHPADFVDPDWDTWERHRVGRYLESGVVAVTYRGLSPCRLCGVDNGHREFTDGEFQWPEGLAHYVHEHSVRPPDGLVRHVLARSDDLEAQRPSLDWWLSATR